jgi:SOS response regulatory protein OraA/RecX
MNYNDFLANGISQFKTRSNDNVKIRFTESGSFTIEHLNSKVSSDADNKITSLLGNYSSGSTYGNTNLDFGIFSPFMNTNNYLNTFFSKDLNNPIYGFSNSGFSKSETTTSVPASNENPWNNVSSLNEILSKIFAHMKEDDNTISDQKTEIDKLREENKKLNDQLLKEQEKTKSLSDSISKLEKENKLDDAKIAELVKENSIDDALIAKLKKENKLDDETIDKLNKQVSHYKEEILNLSSVISDLQKENKLDDAKIAELVKENKIDDATIEKLEKQGKLDKITI